MIKDDPRWLPVLGWEGIYEVSSAGHVRRVGSGRNARPGRILRATLQGGYPVVTLAQRPRPKRNYGVHRLVAEAFLGAIPPDREVNHINGDRGDPRVENLEIISHASNILHAHRVTKTMWAWPKGEAHWHAKLTENAVRAIRTLCEKPRMQREASRMFGVSRHTIQAILRGDTWSHVK
jgi:hypothetical protein